jgi:hypothetical protein
VVGLVERFDESMELLAREFGWRSSRCVVVNRTESRPALAEIPAETIELIAAANALDMALYERAQESFADRIRSAAPVGAP